MDTLNKVEDKLSKIISNDYELNQYDNLHPTDDNYMLHSPKCVGYNTTAEQQYMFQNLLIGFNPNNYSILDIGCGRADLYGYLLESYDNIISYQGLDFNPNMSTLAKQKYNIDITLGQFGIAELKSADWVVASGFFTPRRCESEDEDLKKLFKDIDIMYSLANNCVSFNLLSPIGNKINESFFYVHPGLIMDMLIEKYKYVTVRANYSNDVYTVTIYKF
jgi:SAM-dependent methyltransferase